MIAPLDNVSGEELRILDVGFVGLEMDGAIEVRRVGIARFDEEANLALGTYKTFPPVGELWPAGGCGSLDVQEVAGFRLAPGERALIVTHIRARAPGDFNIRGHRVTYEQGGQRFVQTIPTGHAGGIAQGGTSYEPADDEIRCAQELGMQLLESG